MPLVRNKKKKRQEDTYRLRINKEAIIHFIDGREIGHVRKEDIHFNSILQTRPPRFEDCTQILQDLSLETTVISHINNLPTNVVLITIAYRSVLD